MIRSVHLVSSLPGSMEIQRNRPDLIDSREILAGQAFRRNPLKSHGLAKKQHIEFGLQVRLPSAYLICIKRYGSRRDSRARPSVGHRATP